MVIGSDGQEKCEGGPVGAETERFSVGPRDPNKTCLSPRH
jgi:hypothetical protein